MNLKNEQVFVRGRGERASQAEAVSKGPESCMGPVCPERGEENHQGTGQGAGPEGWQG